MKYIVISGIDGSGKTTIINALKKRLEDDGFEVKYFWMRYNHIICKPIHALCRIIGLSKKYETKRGKVWRHDFYKSQIFCSFYIFLTWIDTWLGRLKLLGTQKYDYVICDRWINDILIDLAVKSRRSDLLCSKWYKRFKKIQPANTFEFAIVRDRSAVIHSRLENEDDPDLDLRMIMYEKLSSWAKVNSIDNNETIDKSVNQICAILGLN